ncbi:hypothetical protein DGMP_04190 [Desulfomarina profundi]|uniref:Uncharacterized protein n=2 Tax=Desulfomarina profundi TaxID=2772557 RepID=A0A8D5FQT8_9BACT|nr:hypothetical protein DGMP_04190 [Desulfomarina profundi]
MFLRSLAEKGLISQLGDGQLVLGYKGENLVGHYSFYTAFSTPDEYRLEFNGKVIGTVPIDKPLTQEQHIIFAGKRWEVILVDDKHKLITLKKAKGGTPPQFSGDGLNVHDIVRQEMQQIYSEKQTPVYLNEAALLALKEGFDYFHALNLDSRQIIQMGNMVHAFPWLGDRVTNTITVLLQVYGLKADSFGGVIDIRNCTLDDFFNTVKKILYVPQITSTELASNIPDTVIEKHDPFLPKTIRDIGYGSRTFDVDGAYKWLTQIVSSTHDQVEKFQPSKC